MLLGPQDGQNTVSAWDLHNENLIGRYSREENGSAETHYRMETVGIFGRL